MASLTTKFGARLWIAVLTVSIAFGASFLVLYRVGAVEIRPLQHPVADLKTQIGSFVGEDHEMDPTVAKRVGAKESISRKYENPAGVEISLHVAAFTAVGEPTLPHPPSICYPASGWRIVSQQSVPIPGMEKPARVMTVEREGTRSLVMYWYCWNPHVCTTRSEAVWTRLKLVGHHQWPPAIKVLMEMPLDRSPEASLEVLVEFAGQVREQTKDL